MAVVSQGKNEFSARIQRIEKRGAGVSEVFNAGGPRARHHIGRARRACHGCVMKLPLALVVGALSFLAAQYALFRLGGLPDIPREVTEILANPDYLLAGQALVALFLVFTARLFFNLTAKTHTVLSIAGMAAAMSLTHNLVHIAPEPWAQLFSPGWVNEVRASTEPNTLHFRGFTYPLAQLTLG